MQLSLCFGRRECSGVADARAEKLEKILAAARRTAFYGPLLTSPSIEVGSVEQAVSSLPPIGIATYLENRERFRNPGVRLALFATDRVHTVPNGWRAMLGFPAEAIAGPLQALFRLAGRRERIPASARRVVVHTGLGEPLVPDRAREGLWRAFDLPLFEELRGSGGELLAFECDAHAGLHLETDSAVFEMLDGELVVTSLVAVTYPVLRLRTGLTGTIDHRTCPCGGTVARFLPAAAAAAVRKPPSRTFEMRLAKAAGA